MTLIAVIQSDKSVSNIPVYSSQPKKSSIPTSLKDPRLSNIASLENKMKNIINLPENLATQSMPLYFDALAELQREVDMHSGKKHSAWSIEKPEKELNTVPPQNKQIPDQDFLTPLHTPKEINDHRQEMIKEDAEFDVMQKMKTLRNRNNFKPYFNPRKETMIKTKNNGLFQK